MTDTSSNKQPVILIVGGVAAGATAAARARRLSDQAKIILLEGGPDISFANCGLPYYIGGDIDSRSKLLLQSPESFKDQYNVDVFTNTLVTSIEREKHQVICQDQEDGSEKVFVYDKLILAQGGRPLIPKIAGAEQEHVFSLWTLADMDAIDRFLKEENPQSAVVVGGGFVGLEMVEALSKRGLKVSVVEAMPHVMNIMEAEMSGFIEQEMLSYGVDIHTGISLEKIQKNNVILGDGKKIDADMVLLSIGVRPTLELAQKAGLTLGQAGGLLVDEFLQTNDPDIYAAGDMVEIEHRILAKKVRIPLAGPANRQGRIAAENALGGKHAYKGSLGTSIVRVFKAVVGSSGLSLKAARAAGMEADAVTVHKEHHTSYYPGAETVSLMVIYEKGSGRVLGGQSAGYQGSDRRLDVLATAAAAGLTVHDLADVDFAYSPPLGTANDVINMAAFTAENKLSGFSPSINACDLDAFVQEHNPLFVDVRDVFAFEKSNIKGSAHIPLEFLAQKIKHLPDYKPIIVYDESGKKGHQALRMLVGNGLKNIYNISGGFISLQRHARSFGFKHLQIDLLPVEKKSLQDLEEGSAVCQSDTKESDTPSAQAQKQSGALVIDVRTEGEFHSGAYPGSINIPLDRLPQSLQELGSDFDKEIIVYCASGARSSYAQTFLEQQGFTNVTNGGGLMHMMMNAR